MKERTKMKRFNQLKGLLQANGLRVTTPRLQLLQLIADFDSAFSQNHLERRSQIDRTTIYRTLLTFEEHRLIHRVLDKSGKVNFIRSANSSDSEHGKTHLHFSCERCLKVFCLQDIVIPAFKFPPNYDVNEISLTVFGLCATCNGNK